MQSMMQSMNLALRSPHAALRLSLLVLLVLGCLSCSSYPDKRLLQYLNTSGFGNRYTGNAEEDNYVRIGDTLGVTDSYNPDELEVQARVDIDGTVLLPELGAVRVAGMTRTEIEALLMEKYQNYFDLVDIKVSIFTQGKFFYVFGEVEQEGSMPFTGDVTVFEAVMEAVPNKNTANLGRVQLIRPDPRDPLKIWINLGDMLESGDSTFNVLVQERDIVFIPPTMLAKVGYFLDTLLFPVKQVLTGLSSSIFTLTRLDQTAQAGSIF